MSALEACKAALLCAGIAFSTGCYTYRLVDSPPIGSIVRVRVPVTSALNSRNSAPETASIEGHLIDVGDTIAVATETRRELGAYREIVQFDTLRLAMSQTSSLEVREFSRSRSILLGTSIAAIAGTAAAVAFGLGGGGDPPDSGGGGPVTSIVVSPSIVSVLWGLIVR